MKEDPIFKGGNMSMAQMLMNKRRGKVKARWKEESRFNDLRGTLIMLICGPSSTAAGNTRHQ